MSYSRWGSSCWYTFWSSSSDEDRDNQVFEVCDMVCPMRFTYRELSCGLDECIDQVRKEFGQKRKSRILVNVTEDGEYVYDDVDVNPIDYSEKEFEELKGYMKEFMEDVEENYA